MGSLFFSASELGEGILHSQDLFKSTVFPIELGTASLEAASKYSQQESGLLLSTSVFPEFSFSYDHW